MAFNIMHKHVDDNKSVMITIGHGNGMKYNVHTFHDLDETLLLSRRSHFA